MARKELILRDYQVPAADYVLNNDKCVLAVTPNGGKTEIAINVISRYMSINPQHKVLILTHSTNVLLDNFVNRLDEIIVDFEYTTNFEPEIPVHLCLPNSENKLKCCYDFLIVDEAHENYLATRVQRIIELVQPQKQLLLTGTPSKFIKEGGYNFHYIAANEIADQYFSKLNVELAASAYDWVDRYNSQNEVETSFQFNLEETKETLEEVMNHLIKRFKHNMPPEQFNHPNFLTKIKSWAFTYKTIGKTLIVCKTIEQADQVRQILNEKLVDVGISHSECDFESSEVTRFKNGELNVLIVVNRARLGYSDEKLINIIDMSGTHNPDIIYQMMMRATRGNPEIQKYYMKLTPNKLHNMTLTHLSVCAALMLTDKQYLEKYDGSNFNNIEIPIIKRNYEEIDPNDESEINKTKKERLKEAANRLPKFTYDVIDTFKDILHNLNNPVSIYKITTIAESKAMLGYKSPIKKTYEELLESPMGLRNFTTDEIEEQI